MIMSHIPKITMIGLYNYNDQLFNDMTLPEGVDKDVFINSFLLKYGEAPVIYTSYDFMKTALKFWGQKWYNSIERIIRAETEDYNPLHNFDRNEEYNDIETETGNVDSKYENSGSADSSGTAENKVSAYNATTYQPDNIQNNENETNTSESGSNTEKRSNKRNLDHTAHLYGNIGVTKSQEMLVDELNVRTEYNLYDVLCELLYREVCLYLY